MLLVRIITMKMTYLTCRIITVDSIWIQVIRDEKAIDPFDWHLSLLTNTHPHSLCTRLFVSPPYSSLPSFMLTVHVRKERMWHNLVSCEEGKDVTQLCVMWGRQWCDITSSSWRTYLNSVHDHGGNQGERGSQQVEQWQGHKGLAGVQIAVPVPQHVGCKGH